MVKSPIKKVIEHAKEAILLTKEYGLTCGLYYGGSKTTVGRLNKRIVQSRMKFNFNWVCRNYADICHDFQYESSSPKSSGVDLFQGKYPVWVYWEQGIENAPELVKMCFNSVLENARGGGTRLSHCPMLM